jgi:hypothetical protein
VVELVADTARLERCIVAAGVAQQVAGIVGAAQLVPPGIAPVGIAAVVPDTPGVANSGLVLAIRRVLASAYGDECSQRS